MVLVASAGACASGEPPRYVDCPDCPVLVLGAPDTPEWEAIDRADETAVANTTDYILMGCHYGLAYGWNDEVYAISDTASLDDVKKKFSAGETIHHAVIGIRGEEKLEAGQCYQMKVFYVRTEPPESADDLSVHHFLPAGYPKEVVELSTADWQAWQAASR